MRRLALILATLAAAFSVCLKTVAGADDTRTYRIELLNAFGVFKGSDIRIAGVRSGVVTDIEINEKKRAEVTFEVTGELATLGDETTCTTEPQSLIAEFFIDCRPKGEPMPENSLIPASRVEQSIQNDLLFNTFRESYRERLRLIVNELGTAMASNADNLNDAIRLAVPALTDFREVTRILANQRREIDRLNVNAEQVISRLAARRGEVTAAIAEGRDAAEATASRSADLSTDVDALDDFLAELDPTLAELGATAREGTPLLAGLRTAAPGLNELAGRLPAFNAASEDAIVALGEAAVPGHRALVHGRDEIRDLAEAGRNAPASAEILGDFVDDLDDPRRVVEEDERAERSCDDKTLACWGTGRKGPTGYTGIEALLNYVYYQSGAINQFDSFGHFLNFNVFDVGGGPCGGFNAGPDVPARDGGRTTDITEAHGCVSWIGENQPDVNLDLGLPRYDNSVCPDGSTELSLCDPAISTHDTGGYVDRGAADETFESAATGRPGAAGEGPGGGGIAADTGPGGDAGPGGLLPPLLPEDEAEVLEDLLDRPGAGGGGSGPGGGPSDQATENLLDFLYGN